MSEPAVFVLIRDGQRRYYDDRWANAFLFREIFWGPEALEQWLDQGDEIDQWTDEAAGGAVVDFDNRRLVWHGDNDILEVPRVAAAYEKLLQTAWPGFRIDYGIRGLMDLAAAAGEADAEDYDDETPQRRRTVREAAGYYQDDDSEEHDEEDETDTADHYHDEETRAWITLVDREGVVRQRNVEGISEDLIRGRESAIKLIVQLPAAEIPRESSVIEGMWIDQTRGEIGFWGGRLAREVFPEMQRSWDGWTVRWAENGYADQCAISGPAGIPMSDLEALGEIVPTLLSTRRFDLHSVLGAVGGQIKKTAIKATGCLTLVLCAPVLLFGAISGNWQATGITVGVVVACVVVLFKVIEFKFKRKFAVIDTPVPEDEVVEQRAPVAGPADEKKRRERLNEILQAAGFPAINEIEPHFARENVANLFD